jgi:hypothetical protein
MSRGSRVVALVVVFVLVATCGISLVSAAGIGAETCSLATGWGPPKTDSGSYGLLLLDLAPAPVAISASTALLPVRSDFPVLIDRIADQVLAEPASPRAPPRA